MKPIFSNPRILRSNFKAKKSLLLILFNLIFSGTFSCMSSYVYAGSESSGAGNDLAINFINATKSAISYVNTHESEFPEFKEKNLAALLNQATQNLTVSIAPVYAELENGKLQESSAFSQWVNKKPSITLNGSQQSDFNLAKTTNATIMSALGLHELAVLTGVEKTGDYHVSQRFLGAKKIICPDPIGICGPATYTTVFYEFKYDSAQYIPAENRLKIINPYYVSSEPVEGEINFKIDALFIDYLFFSEASNTELIILDTVDIVCKYFGAQFNAQHAVSSKSTKLWTIYHRLFRKNLSENFTSQWERRKLSETSFFGDIRYHSYLTEIICDTTEAKK
ncbi:MAG: hypothetical protein ABL927_10915 [Bdellovibrionales bacterium]